MRTKRNLFIGRASALIGVVLAFPFLFYFVLSPDYWLGWLLGALCITAFVVSLVNLLK